MAHQDFEKYAEQRLMNGVVSGVFKSFFQANVAPVLKKDFRVLDYGCGDGKYFEFFKQFTGSENIFGAEISSKRVSRCRDAGWGNVQKINPGKRLPFPDSFFDLISFDQVIEHVACEETPFYLGELERVLTVNGLIVVMTPNYPIKRFYDMLSAIQKRDILKLKDDPTHVTKYNFRKLKDTLSEYFEVLKLQPTGGFLWDRLKYHIFSHKIIALARKKH